MHFRPEKVLDNYYCCIYHKEEKRNFVFLPTNLACLETATGGLYVILSQVVVYAPAERADKFSMVPLSPSLLCARED